MPATVTLRDVAALAGVHTSTASRALGHRTRSVVDAGTVARIEAAARELGYRPNSLARGLKTNRTFTVGVLLPDLTNPLFPPIVRGIEDCLADADYIAILANTDNHPDKEEAILSAMDGRRVDGLILATAERESARIERLVAGDVPVVLVNRTPNRSTCSSVVGDDHAGIGQAVDHLVKLGHSRIAHLGGPQHVSTGLNRFESFMWWVERAGLQPAEELVVFADWFHEEPGARACSQLLDRGADFTAIVAANDLIALGCYDRLGEAGIQIGRDVSVTGYNDMLFADKLCPPLTTVRIPQYQIGLRAAELLLRQIAEPNSEALKLQLGPSLMVRQSTHSPPGKAV